MNTGKKNTKGRTIFRGPRGGEYVLGPSGTKIRSFKVATGAAVTVPVNLEGFTKTRFEAHLVGRHVYKKNSSGRYYTVKLNSNGRPTEPSMISRRELVKNVRTGVVKSISDHLKNGPNVAAPAPHTSPPPHKRVAKMMRLGNKWIAKNGTVYRKNGRVYNFGSSYKKLINVRRNAYAKDSKYLYKSVIPYLRPENGAAPAKLKLTRAHYDLHQSDDPEHKARVFYNKNGQLYYVTLNGRKINIRNASWPFKVSHERIYRLTQREIANRNAAYPRSAIPPATPNRNRSSPILMNNMMQQIYGGGRGSNINAGRYTEGERKKLVKRLENSIQFFKGKRDDKKAEATQSRAALQAGGLSNSNKQRLKNRAAAANERVGYFDDAVRAYTRGLRALQPLSGNVPAKYRRAAATPNRSSPAPESEEFDAIYMPLEKPHLVVKTPGVGKIYLNPNSFRGLVKDAARVNIPEANVREWLRMARNKFPDEPLFRHPIATSKNVTASHIRFSRS